MARRRSSHTLLYVAAAGVGGWAAYQYLYKPWAAQRTAAGLPVLPLLPSLPAPAVAPALPAVNLPPAEPGLPAPIGFTSLGPQYGGVLGRCIAAKGGTWSPQKCQARLDQLADASRSVLASLPAAQAALAANQAALAGSLTNYTAAMAAGDTAKASIWHTAMSAHQADIDDLTARIADGNRALRDHDNDYFSLTGAHLFGLAA